MANNGASLMLPVRTSVAFVSAVTLPAKRRLHFSVFAVLVPNRTPSIDLASHRGRHSCVSGVCGLPTGPHPLVVSLVAAIFSKNCSDVAQVLPGSS